MEHIDGPCGVVIPILADKDRNRLRQNDHDYTNGVPDIKAYRMTDFFRHAARYHKSLSQTCSNYFVR